MVNLRYYVVKVILCDITTSTNLSKNHEKRGAASLLTPQIREPRIRTNHINAKNYLSQPHSTVRLISHFTQIISQAHSGFLPINGSFCTSTRGGAVD